LARGVASRLPSAGKRDARHEPKSWTPPGHRRSAGVAGLAVGARPAGPAW
jgi:hypothetical protein